jgi:hypothetical protein
MADRNLSGIEFVKDSFHFCPRCYSPMQRTCAQLPEMLRLLFIEIEGNNPRRRICIHDTNITIASKSYRYSPHPYRLPHSFSNRLTRSATASLSQPLPHLLSQCPTRSATASFAQPMRYSLSHCFTHSATASLARPLAHSLGYCFPRSANASLARPLPLTRSANASLAQPMPPSFRHCPPRSDTASFVQPLPQSFRHCAPR